MQCLVKSVFPITTVYIHDTTHQLLVCSCVLLSLHLLLLRAVALLCSMETPTVGKYEEHSTGFFVMTPTKSFILHII